MCFQLSEILRKMCKHNFGMFSDITGHSNSILKIKAKARSHISEFPFWKSAHANLIESRMKKAMRVHTYTHTQHTHKWNILLFKREIYIYWMIKK